MLVEVLDGLRAGIPIQSRIELQTEATAEPLVALGAEVRPRLGQREVEVEENRLDVHTRYGVGVGHR